jgi:predicted GIY-YIG superfamily endonuclease
MLAMAHSILANASRQAPNTPGVYYMLAADGELLYVGKAGKLRTRLAQHAQANPPGGRLALLYKLATAVRYEPLPSDAATFVREADVIVALQPRFNASHSLDGKWNYITVTALGDGSVRLEVTQRPAKGMKAYGCFPHLGPGVSSPPAIACTEGYAALLRLLWAASDAAGHMPARITRASAPLAFEVSLDPSVKPALHSFLGATSERLLRILPERYARRDGYMQQGLGRDLLAAAAFFQAGPRALRDRRLRHHVRATTLSPLEVRELIGAEVREAIGEFKPPPLPDERDEFLGARAHRWARADG